MAVVRLEKAVRTYLALNLHTTMPQGDGLLGTWIYTETLKNRVMTITFFSYRAEMNPVHLEKKQGRDCLRVRSC